MNITSEEFDRIQRLLDTGTSLTRDQIDVLVEVTKQLLAERGGNSNHYTRKCLWHAVSGNIHDLKKNLKRIGIDPRRLDAILPLI